MKQMREEQQRRRLVETKRTREIAQLRKEQRRQEVRAPPGPGLSPRALAPLLTTRPGRPSSAVRRCLEASAAPRGKAGQLRAPSLVPVWFRAGPGAPCQPGPSTPAAAFSLRRGPRAQPSTPGSLPLPWLGEEAERLALRIPGLLSPRLLAPQGSPPEPVGQTRLKA